MGSDAVCGLVLRRVVVSGGLNGFRSAVDSGASIIINIVVVVVVGLVLVGLVGISIMPVVPSAAVWWWLLVPATLDVRRRR